MAHMPQTSISHVLTAGKTECCELKAVQVLQLAVVQLWDATEVKAAEGGKPASNSQQA